MSNEARSSTRGRRGSGATARQTSTRARATTARKPRDQAPRRAVGELRGDAPAPAPHDLPWGYDRTRITAIARDPSFLYVGWEVTDGALEAARAQLGMGGAAASCVLRVHDTTFRLFDGHNANGSFDVPVDRAWNHYFLRVDRPRATFHVDIGLASADGSFALLARSGAAEMPPDGVAADGPREWMTVMPHQATPRARPYRHRFKPAPMVAHAGGWGGSGPGGGSWAPSQSVSIDFNQVLASLVGGHVTQGEWYEQVMGGRVVRWVRWTGTRKITTWRTSSASGFVESLGPVEVWFEGQRRVLTDAGGMRSELGPWHLVIAGLDAKRQRRVFDTWLIHVMWETGATFERAETPALYRRIKGGYRHRQQLGDGSEQLVREEVGSSEELMVGASERVFVGASELMIAGGSEVMALGASEVFGFGASELAWLGASETLLGGASLYRLGGASGQEWGGASEVLLGGASPGGAAWGSALGGASELSFVGGSELVVGLSSGQGWGGFSVLPATDGPLAGRGSLVSAAAVLTASARLEGRAVPAAPTGRTKAKPSSTTRRRPKR